MGRVKVSRAQGRALLVWFMQRIVGCGGMPRWSERVTWAQERWGVAQSTARAIASGRIGAHRASEIQRLAEWEGRQAELPPPTTVEMTEPRRISFTGLFFVPRVRIA